jgi:hypothetical protein
MYARVQHSVKQRRSNMAKRYELFNQFDVNKIDMEWLPKLLNKEQPDDYKIVKRDDNYIEVILEWEKDKE